MRGNASKYPDKQRTAADRRGEMALYLYQSRDSAFAVVTVDELVARYGVDRKTAEYELTIARQKRAGGGA
mgnify:CR=1 FL=1